MSSGHLERISIFGYRIDLELLNTDVTHSVRHQKDLNNGDAELSEIEDILAMSIS